MTSKLTINHANHTIVMNRAFAKNANDARHEDYAHLQAVRRDYPNYTVVQRHIRTNSDKNTYAGLTYEYMESYILTHGTEETRKTNFDKYQDMRVIAECQGKAFRYPVIKKWFLAQYPEIARFGMTETEIAIEDAKAAVMNTVPSAQDQQAA